MKGPKLLKRVAVFALALVMVLGIVPVMPIEVRAAKPEDMPDAMWNSSILNAWEYLGAGEYTPVADLKRENKLFLETNPEVLYNYHAGIEYPVGGGGSNYGMSTTDDLSTYTGKAPRVTGSYSFRSLGFVCASFTTYYILNYKYNIEGLDCPDFRNAMFYYTKDPEVDEEGEPILSTGLGYSYHAVKTWYHCLADMTDSQYFLNFVPESQNVKRIYEHEFENPAPIPVETIAKMQPGDVLIYGRYRPDDEGVYKKVYSHVSIYAGSYGGYDFIVHCPGPGGNYGPTMGILAADFDQEGGKESAHVVAVYRLNYVPLHETSITVKKQNEAGEPLAGAVFTATHTNGTAYDFPATGTDGTAKLSNIPFGTYIIKEKCAPEGYHLSDVTQTVTVGASKGVVDSTPANEVNDIYHVTTDPFVDEPKPQTLQIIKTTDTDTDFAGWQFEVRDSENNLVGTYTATADDAKKQGVVCVEGLEPGEYTVKEIIPAGSNYETEEDTKTVTVSVGGENSVTFHNTIKRGSIEIKKTDSEDQPLAGAAFTATHDQFGEVYTFPETDEQGFAKLENLPYGTYTVEEIKAPAGYVLPDTTWTVTVGEGAGESVNSVLPVTNDPINQTLQIIKTTDTDTDFAGWQFEVRDSENNLVGTYTTTADGTKKQGVVCVEGLEPGEYTVKEIIPAGSDYETEEDTKTVTVAFGGTNSVTFHNTIKHCSIVVQKVTDSGKELEGWEIELYRDSVAPANLVDTKTTDEEGKVEFADLMPGKYIVHEKTEKEFWVNKTGDITVELQPGGSTTVNMENELRGDLKIVKEVSDGDASIDGWQFKITNVTDEDNPVELGIFTTQNGGVILKEDIAPGVYLVEEIIPEGSEYKCVGDNPKTVEVKAGQVNTVTFKNEVKRGSITVHKITNTENEEDKYGWTIELYRNSVADGNLVATIITSAENGGMVVFDDLLPGTYVVHESTEKDFWVNATGDITVELAADEKADVTIQNDSLGDLKILKKILDGDASVEGWQFKVTDITDPENPVEIGTFTTDKDGVILKEDLEEGSYLVEEIIPEGSDYICNCENPQTVTIVKGDTTKVTFENRVLRGSITVQKSVNSNDPEALKGWEVELYLVEGDTETLKETKTTDQNGQVLFSNLLPGTYIVREKTQKDFWLDETGDVTVVLKPKVNETEEVTLKNCVYGDLEIVKKVLDGDASVEGWQFKVTNITDPENPVEIGTFTTDKDGITLKEDLEEGTYLVEEIIPDDSEYVCIGENPREIEVKAEQVNEVIFENELEKGEAKIIKITNTGENLEGWKFNIYTDKEKTNLVEGSPFTTDEEGLIVERLLPGTYYIQEVDESATKPGWIFATELKEVTIAAFETEEVRFENTQQGVVKIVKTILNGEASAEGWTFRITNITDAENPVEIGEFTTDAEGIICKYLLPGTYKVEELTTKDPLYYSKAENPVTVEIKAGETETVSFQNAMKLGEFEIIKVDTYGNPLEGAIFLVEWSEDGENWAPVTSCTIENAVKGGCTSPNLDEGKLVTGKDGIAKFTGLWPELQYRITEAQAPPGYWMQKKIVFNDKLTLDDLDLSWKVVNKKMTITPEDPDNPGTGDINLPALMGVSALSLVCILGLAILPGMKRSKKRVR